jgi:peptidoglycan/LPS O-acetylase OafA/YrhL
MIASGGLTKYYPQLDGLRGLAILTVLAGHFLPSKISTTVGEGDSGVVIFFCLSGFLITTILLASLESCDNFAKYLSHFYLRRSLRIFPIYYLTIAVCVAVDYGPVVDNFWRLTTYTVNFTPGLPTINSLGAASHLWSLSVEEQFYWLWPLLIFFFRKRSLLHVVVSVTLIAAAWKYCAASNMLVSIASVDDSLFLYRYLFRSLPSCVDSLGAGAALAIIHFRAASVGKPTKPLFAKHLVFAIAIMFACLTAYRSIVAIDPWYRGSEFFGILYFHSVVLMSLVAIHWGISRGPWWFEAVFSHPFIVYTGKISYGMYIYHVFIAEVMARNVPPSWYGGRFSSIPLTAAVYLVASASYFLLERPLLKMKDRVSPLTRSATAEAT